MQSAWIVWFPRCAQRDIQNVLGESLRVPFVLCSREKGNRTPFFCWGGQETILWDGRHPAPPIRETLVSDDSPVNTTVPKWCVMDFVQKARLIR